MAANMTLTPGEVLSTANLILTETGFTSNKLVSLRQCNSTLFVAFYKSLTGREPPLKREGAWSTSSTSETVKCQCIIDAVSKLLPPEISLSHISGRDIAKCDLLGLKNLLDIFAILLGCVAMTTPEVDVTMPKVVTVTVDTMVTTSDKEDDSNMLTEQGLQVINEVLEEELNSTFQNTSSLLRGVSTTPTEDTPPPVNIPSAVPHTNVLTTPFKHARQLATPLHSTPRQYTQRKLTRVSNTPPLSISTLSSDSTTPITNRDHTHNSTSSSQLESHPLNEVGVVNQETNRNEVPKHVEEVEKGEGPDISLSRATVVKKIVENYVKRKTDKAKMPRPPMPRPPNINRVQGKHLAATNNRCSLADRRNGRGLKSEPHPQQGDLLIEVVEGALPGIKLSPATIRRYWSREMTAMRARMTSCPLTVDPVKKKMEEMELRHNTQVQVMKKDLQHTRRMQSKMEETIQRTALQSIVRNQRIANARSKRYFNDYEMAVRGKLQRKRTRQELILRDAYEECVRLMKDKTREMRRFAKDNQLVETKKYEVELAATEKFYNDQLKMLASTIKDTESNTRTRNKAYKQDVKRRERELRKTLESDISELWAGLDNWEEDCVHFRQIDKAHLLKQMSGRNKN